VGTNVLEKHTVTIFRMEVEAAHSSEVTVEDYNLNLHDHENKKSYSN
jgi:hypothetical protein